ncbi:DUF4365 domain-containing protein [Pedobacter sp. ISL-68]|uniref:DUF4365 domain-containing protein n=1 Tax=unclassified Pedobacter TaxID=2628915 RepID=UPI001BECA4C9|nr:MULTISPECIES: DUF4365 domain-containing protein [unclassified Pedobacter]MBT2564695.1 DUF4365 domain-containing protein [Pedobacter sp. ISL-64]MBT2592416.1 DUF4365 domain-containing protein [Pedobacter sp. ISL-68]
MTFRNPHTKTEQQGIRYVESVVQDSNSIIQKIDRDNDQGNDGYIEFVNEGLATNYGVFVQIKSGKSYKDNKGYKIPAKSAHLNYWYGGLNLNVGIVYDPEIGKAFWVDFKEYINSNPQILSQKTHDIRIDEKNEFCIERFSDFMEYCNAFKEQLTGDENYGRSLDWFAYVEQPEKCYEGLKSLYANHRNKPSTWFYIISSFSKISEEGIRRTILGLLSNYVSNPNVFWHSANIQYYPPLELQENIKALMSKYFRQLEIEFALPYMENGINKGSFSYLVFLVINLVEDLDVILNNIAFHSIMDNDKRNFCFWLYMHVAKYKSQAEVLQSANKYFSKFTFGNDDEALVGLRESIKNNEITPVG